jgi:SNF2 family DNA or RNA helicase
MRGGKSALHTWWLESLPDTFGANLIIAPLTVLGPWEEHLRGESIDKVDLTRNQRRFVLANYEMLLRKPDLLFMPWRSVGLDEARRIANPQAKTTKICLEGFPAVPHKAILCGLPTPESLLEIFCPMKFMYGSFMGYRSYWKFREEFFNEGYNGYDWYPKNGTVRRITEAVHQKAFVKTREDMDVGGSKIFEKRYVEMEPAQKKMYDSLKRDMFYRDADGTPHETNYIVTIETWLHRIFGGFSPDGETLLSNRKASEVVRLLRGELSGQQVVIYCHFRAEVDHVRLTLERDWPPVPCGVIHGGVPPGAERDRIRNEFQAGKYRVIVATPECVQYGLDFSAADTVIYYSCPASGNIRKQSEDRVIHAMKRTPCLYIDLVTEGTEEKEFVDGVHDKGFDSKLVLQNLFKNRANFGLGRT